MQFQIAGAICEARMRLPAQGRFDRLLVLYQLTVLLLQLGSELLPRNAHLQPMAVELPEHLCMPSGTAAEDFIEWIFPDVCARVSNPLRLPTLRSTMRGSEIGLY